MDLKIGGKLIGHTAIAECHIDPEGSPYRKAQLTFDRDALPRGLDLEAQCQILDNASDPKSVQFTGVIEDAEILQKEVVLHLGDTGVIISEQRLGAMWIGPGDLRDITWSFMRLAGVAEDKMTFQGHTVRKRQFEVSAPILDLHVDGSILVAGVRLSRDVKLGDAVKDVDEQAPNEGQRATDKTELVERFRAGPCWAWLLVTAPSLDRAEEIGIERIRRAVAWTHLVGQRSRLGVTNNPEATYSRVVSRGCSPRVGNVVHVRALDNSLRWVRDISPFSKVNSFDLGSANSAALKLDPKLDGHDLWRSIELWSAARQAPDLHSKVSGLWQSIEILVKRTKVQKLFTRQQLDTLIRGIPLTLPEPQRDRLREVIRRANDPPLLIRFRAACDESDINVDDTEISNLVRTRKLRNQLEHGHIPSPADRDSVDAGLRLLAALLLRRCAQS